jgi:N-ethylmaleimide reductase
MDKDLFSPFQLGPIELKNRIVMAPLTRNRANAVSAPTDLMARYYAQRASAGLTITEATHVSPQGIPYPRTPGILSPGQVGGWHRITEAVHGKGGRIFVQLWHGGRISHPSLQPNGALPVAPSAIRPEGEAVTPEGMQPYVTPHELDTEEVPEVVEQFIVAAENAEVAGFDGVEIHAANGYLIDQFLRDGSNRRGDRYGGPVENRVRFLREVVEAVIGVWDAERVGVRISPRNTFNSMHDSDPQALFNHVAECLDDYGLAYLHVTESAPPEGPEQRVDFRELRRRWHGVYMANGGYDRPRAEAALAEGYADLVSFGVPFLANPDLPERLRRNAPLNPPDPDTFYRGDEHGYTDYPTLEEIEPV